MSDDRRVEVSEITVTGGVLEERAQNLLFKELGMQRLCVRWVLYDDHEQICKTIFAEPLDRFCVAIYRG